MPFFDPLYFLALVPGLALALYAQARVALAFRRYSRLANMREVTGADAARYLLRQAGLSGIAVEETSGHLTDHYDPRGRALRLSPSVYRRASVAALGIVAHEVGHAMQHHTGYVPMRIRTGLVPAVAWGTRLGFLFLLVGLIVQLAGLLWLAVLLFAVALAFSLATLPVELNASRRARRMLLDTGMVSAQEYRAASAVLSAAALTYVAALLQGVTQLLYYLVLAGGFRRRK